MTGFDLRFLLLIIPAIAAMVGRRYVRLVFDRHSRADSRRGTSGEEVARELLARQGLATVTVERVPGTLGDHYDSDSKRLRLSEEVASGRSVASLGIAAHEVAHALQDAESSGLHQMRRRIGQLVIRLTPWSGLFLIGGLWFGVPLLVALMGLFLVAMAVFAAVSLPVELAASRCAIRTLERSGLATAEELPGVRQVLRAAALTYVANLAHRIGIVLFVLFGVLAAKGLL